MHKFFNRAPATVARELVGKTLQVGEVEGTIMAVLPQTERDNANWIDRRPIFGSKPNDVYVAPYRGTHLLFLRTGAPNTCVRIDAVSVDGKLYSTPGKVCKALRIDSERTGKMSFNGRMVRVT